MISQPREDCRVCSVCWMCSLVVNDYLTYFRILSSWETSEFQSFEITKLQTYFKILENRLHICFVLTPCCVNTKHMMVSPFISLLRKHMQALSSASIAPVKARNVPSWLRDLTEGNGMQVSSTKRLLLGPLGRSFTLRSTSASARLKLNWKLKKVVLKIKSIRSWKLKI